MPVQSCNVSVGYFIVDFTSSVQLSAPRKFALEVVCWSFLCSDVDYADNNVLSFCKAVF